VSEEDLMGPDLQDVLFVVTESWNVVVDEAEDGAPLTRRHEERLDAFAGAVQSTTTALVSFVDLDSLPGDLTGAMLVGDHDLVEAIRSGKDAEQLLPRTVLLHAGRSAVPGILEELRLAAAIDYHRYFLWRTEPENEWGGGLYARKSIITAMGGSWQPSSVFETANYCYGYHDGYRDLPSLLGAYLDRYAATVG